MERGGFPINKRVGRRDPPRPVLRHQFGLARKDQVPPTFFAGAARGSKIAEFIPSPCGTLRAVNLDILHPATGDIGPAPRRESTCFGLQGRLPALRSTPHPPPLAMGPTSGEMSVGQGRPALGRPAPLLLPRCGVKTHMREFPDITGEHIFCCGISPWPTPTSPKTPTANAHFVSDADVQSFHQGTHCRLEES